MTGRPWAPDSGDSRPLWRSGRLWLGVLLSAVCLVLAVQGIDLAEVAAALRGTSLAWLILSFLLVLVSNLAKGARWRVLLDLDTSGRPRNGADICSNDANGLQAPASSAGQEIPDSPSLPSGGASQMAPEAAPRFQVGILRLTTILLAGTSLNLALPAPRSGDLARAYLGGEAGGVSKSLVLGTIAAEKLLDIAMLAICFLALLPFVAFPEELAARQTPIVGVAVILLLATILAIWQRQRLLVVAQWVLKRLPGRWGQPLLGSTERAMQGLEALRSPRSVVLLMAWSTAIWFLSAAVIYAAFLAQGLPPSWVQAFFVLVVLQAGVAVPSSPGKIGVFQVLCRWALGVFGVPPAAGLAYGILFYVVAVISQMILGALALLWESWRLRRSPKKSENLRSILAQSDESLQNPV